MPLNLYQYAELLDRRNEPKPLGPEPVPFANAKPRLVRLPIRAVIWSGYGTLLLSPAGEPELLPSDSIMRKIAIDKTIAEFKMWASMTRKSGEPHEYMELILKQVADTILGAMMRTQCTELRFELVWRGVLDRLFQKDYKYDVGTFGDADSYAEKIAYFYVRSSQGVSVFPKALYTLKQIAGLGVPQGIHADGQQSSPVQLWRALVEQGTMATLADAFTPALCNWSYEIGVKKDTDTGMNALRASLATQEIEPEHTLVVGSDILRDIAPAKRRGMKTALLVADRGTAKVTPEQLKDEKLKPNALLTRFEQVLDLVSNRIEV